MTAKPRTLLSPELGAYTKHVFKAGWAISLVHDGETYRFDVLVDGRFPYSAIRVALTSKDMFLKWPHVEPRGLLCLPLASSPIVDVSEAADAALASALQLIDQCRQANFVQSELRREFLSYWDHATHDNEKPVYSLLNPSNHSARSIAVWFGQQFALVGEDAVQVRTWLSHRGRTEPSTIVAGVFGHLGEAPVPPFPDRPTELFELLADQSPETLRVLDKCPCKRDVIVVLGATSPSGDGLMAVRITSPNTHGFRKSQCNRPSIKMTLWRTRSEVRRAEIARFDAAWVHGRGLNQALPKLQAAKVLLLGCGSLGSQVAVRLAQSGVGHLTLVDPDKLSPANVGRHALGVAETGQNKAVALATELRHRFSHMHAVEGHGVPWQQFYHKHPDLFEAFDLIVACIGEWSAEGPLAEWQRREGGERPVVYGWLDERGTAAHALVLTGNVPGLSCVLGSDGNLRVPETIWQNRGAIQSEPACGTLFQPYGPIDMALAETLVSKLCLDVLIGSVSAPRHRIYATSTEQLTAAGGKWSDEHLKHRPAGFEGAFEYDRPIDACQQCDACKETA
ncbi:ThiF family adenylyltransferase [Dyella sp.]|uniref:ThiF family adenylyltransferase n=1 Tax=Dyella sp. TaxID=1869338 RepID=UPI002B48DB52|nr:ThiF family adenylyltransferase [Dyella sp.]HKT29157.1 ThiF family adenylyltransferase [Dyella sp.]